jgi:hypothetical protein
VLLLQWFTLTLPFSMSDEKADDAAIQTNIRERLMGGGRPFENVEKAPPQVSTVLSECISLDPFMRPTASAVAQSLLDAIMIEASKGQIAYRLEDPSITDAEVGDDANSIFLKVKLGVKERKKIRQALKKQQPASVPTIWLDQNAYEILLRLELEEKPNSMYALGAALLWGLFEPHNIRKNLANPTGIYTSGVYNPTKSFCLPRLSNLSCPRDLTINHHSDMCERSSTAPTSCF